MAKRAVPGSREVMDRIARTIARLGDREAALVYGVSERTVRQWRAIAAGKKPLRTFPGFRSRKALRKWDQVSREVLQAQNIAARAAFEMADRRAREAVLRQIGVPPPPPTGEPVPSPVVGVQTAEALRVSERWEQDLEARLEATGHVRIQVEGVDIDVVTYPVAGRSRGVFPSVADAVRAFSMIKVPHYFVIVRYPDGRAELIDTSRKPKKGRRGKRGA